jgi:hypothetical protein
LLWASSAVAFETGSGSRTAIGMEIADDVENGNRSGARMKDCVIANGLCHGVRTPHGQTGLAEMLIDHA